MSKRRALVLFGGVIVVVGAVAAASAASRGEDATEVRTEEVERRDLVSAVTASGRIQPQRQVEVSSDITGRITRLTVQEGDWVEAGRLVVQIEPDQFEAAVTRAEAALSGARAEEARARAERDQAQRTLERNLRIREQNADLIAEETIENAQRDFEVNEALHEAAVHRVSQAEATHREAQDQLAKTQIRAPMAGRVTRVAVEVGEVAVPGTFSRETALLLTISDLDVIQTVVDVDETDVVRISVGDSAQVEIDAFPDTSFPGHVSKISNSANLQSAQAAAASDQAVDFEVEITLLNPPPDVRPDLSATARIITDTRRAALAIPIIALTVREEEDDDGETNDREGVFVVRGGVATFLPVTVGIAGDEHFEVTSGLEERDSVVAGPYQTIRDLSDSTTVRSSDDSDDAGQ